MRLTWDTVSTQAVTLMLTLKNWENDGSERQLMLWAWFFFECLSAHRKHPGHSSLLVPLSTPSSISSHRAPTRVAIWSERGLHSRGFLSRRVHGALRVQSVVLAWVYFGSFLKQSILSITQHQSEWVSCQAGFKSRFTLFLGDKNKDVGRMKSKRQKNTCSREYSPKKTGTAGIVLKSRLSGSLHNDKLLNLLERIMLDSSHSQ